MYYFIYFWFYLLSLLPFRVLHLISDIIYFFVYYFVRYRRRIVMQNLLIAFPEKTEMERTRIAKAFYHDLIDTFIEVAKFFSISGEELHKRFSANYDVVDDLYNSGKSVQIHSGHFFNWEFANSALADKLRYPFLAVYMPIRNPAFEKLFYKLRSRFGTHLIAATNFKEDFESFRNKQYCLALVGDQNPGSPMNAWWTDYFGKKAPFIKGPAKGAIANDTAVVFCNFYKVKRGYYRAEFEVLTTEPKAMDEKALTQQFVHFMERTIRERPSNYLWSHRRWKHEWKPEYVQLLIDREPEIK